MRLLVIFFLWKKKKIIKKKALLYISENPNVCKAVVLDSPFSNLIELIAEIGKNKTGLPTFITRKIASSVKKIIQEKAFFDIEKLDIKKAVEKCEIPALFITSKKDKFVSYEHSEILHKFYKGKS